MLGSWVLKRTFERLFEQAKFQKFKCLGWLPEGGGGGGRWELSFELIGTFKYILNKWVRFKIRVLKKNPNL